MRVLHLISSCGLYGSGRVVIELSRSAKLFFDCHPFVGLIESSHNPHTEVYEEALANDLSAMIFPCHGRFDLRLAFRIREFLVQNKIDILHCHDYKSNFYGLLAAGRIVPKVATNHNWLTSSVKSKIYCLIDGLLIRFFDRIIAVSDEIKDKVRRYGIGCGKIAVVYNGIDAGRFSHEYDPADVRSELGISEGHKIIGIVGSLTPEKGHSFLLSAAAAVLKEYKNIKFLIIGDGPLRRNLEDQARMFGIQESIVFAGYRSDIPRVVSQIDIFVLCSLKEGLPMALLEAMAARKPVIASNVGAVPNVLKNMETGVLIEPGDPDSLKEAIISLLGDERGARNLALNGFERVRTHFSSLSMSGKYIKLYSELLSSRVNRGVS